MIIRVSRIVIPVIILVTCIAGFLIIISKPEEQRRPVDENRSTEVVVTEVEQHRGTVNIRVDGQAVPFREIDLSAEVAGRITFKADEARSGRFVTEGEVLFGIDDQDYKVEVHRLENQVKQAGESMKELEAEIQGAAELVKLGKTQVELAQAEYERQLKLYSSEVSTDSERDKAQQQVITVRNALTTVENQQRVLEAKRERLAQAKELYSLQLKKADHDHARTVIQAPFDGVVVRDSVERDDFVNVGTPLVTVEDTSAVEVKCNLQMDELYWIWDQPGASSGTVVDASSGGDYQLPPTPAKVRYRLREQDYVWKGELWRIDGVGLDERTRTVPCRVIVRHPREVFSVTEDGREVEASSGPPALVRGMYVDVEIEAAPRTRLFRVPESAVRPGQKHHVIWVAVEDDEAESADGKESANGEGADGTHKLKAVDVDIVDIEEAAGFSPQAVVHAVRNDLADGDLVVAMPLGKLRNERDELKVTPVPMADDAEPVTPFEKEGQLSSR
jgi:multidrug efflux pump subunit AcrA (membrane-fusion protein)